MTGQELPAEIETFIGVWNSERRTGEDCLVLNVWTPAVERGAQARPVMVWLHGGGFASRLRRRGRSTTAPTSRAAHDVVVVTVNHRLGVLGFLYSRELGGDVRARRATSACSTSSPRSSGCATTSRSSAAIPATSRSSASRAAAARSTLLLGMPSAQGLFPRAIVDERRAARGAPPEAARASATCARALGVGTDVEALRKVDADAYVQASLAISGSGVAGRYGRRPDHHSRPSAASREAVRAGPGAASTSCSAAPPTRWSRSWARPSCSRPTSDAARDAARHARRRRRRHLRRVPGANPGDSPASIFLLIVSDQVMRIPHIRYAEALIDGGATNPRLYLFDFRRPGLDGVEQAGHGSDMPFFFDNLDKAPASDGPHAAPLVRAMSGALVALARSGDPNHAGPSVVAGLLGQRPPTMLFDVESRVENDPMSAARRVWDDRSLYPAVGSAAMGTGVTVVTGAASGMGLATARRLLRPRETMLLVDLDAAKLDSVRADLAEYAAGPEWVQTAVADVTDTDAMARVAEQVRGLGPFRTLAHAAGISPTMGEWWPMIHVDLVGTARILAALLPLVEPGAAAVCWASNSAHIGATPAGDPVLDAILDDPLAPDLRARLEAALAGRWDGAAGSGEAYGWAKRGVIRLVRREASAWARARWPALVGVARHHQHADVAPGARAATDDAGDARQHAGAAHGCAERGRRSGRVPRVRRGGIPHGRRHPHRRRRERDDRRDAQPVVIERRSAATPVSAPVARWPSSSARAAPSCRACRAGVSGMASTKSTDLGACTEPLRSFTSAISSSASTAWPAAARRPP